jgi:hypothetical protein
MMRTRFVILAVLAIAGALAAINTSAAAKRGANPRVTALNCRDSYNEMVLAAKSALREGDRRGALDLLIGARRVAATCPEVGKDPSLRAVLAADFTISRPLSCEGAIDLLRTDILSGTQAID